MIVLSLRRLAVFFVYSRRGNAITKLGLGALSRICPIKLAQATLKLYERRRTNEIVYLQNENGESVGQGVKLGALLEKKKTREKPSEDFWRIIGGLSRLS